MEFDNPFADLFPDTDYTTQGIIEISNSDDDDAHPLLVPALTESTATPPQPVSDG
jgi:hypothetical protein